MENMQYLPWQYRVTTIKKSFIDNSKRSLFFCVIFHTKHTFFKQQTRFNSKELIPYHFNEIQVFRNNKYDSWGNTSWKEDDFNDVTNTS